MRGAVSLWRSFFPRNVITKEETCEFEEGMYSSFGECCQALSLLTVQKIASYISLKKVVETLSWFPMAA